MNEIIDITTSCSPVSTGYIANGGWVWSYPAIGKVAGTAGNLEKWVTGYMDLWQDAKDPSKEERTFRWYTPEGKESAWEWYDKQAE